MRVRGLVAGVAMGIVALSQMAGAQSSQPEALRAVKAAVQAELASARSDRSLWMYRDTDEEPGKKAVYNTVETPVGTLRRMIELDGRPVDAAQERAETQRIDEYVHDKGEQAKARKNAAHDDAQAEELLKMLPEAFVWTLGGETSDTVTLNFAPNPTFRPPDTQARVLGAMAGQIVVTKNGNRIKTLRGSLQTDIIFGLAVFGKLNKGGTFDVERRQVAPGYWEIAETHVHIGGHALLFKSIGQQEDEVKTEWRPSTATTLEAAEAVLKQ